MSLAATGDRQSTYPAYFVLKMGGLALERKPLRAADTIEIGAHRDSSMKTKIDPHAVQALIKAAKRQEHAPGKYDVFAWVEDQKLRSLTIAWKSYTRRSIALESVGIDGGEEIPTNADPLPNGMARNSASYVGFLAIAFSTMVSRSVGMAISTLRANLIFGRAAPTARGRRQMPSSRPPAAAGSPKASRTRRQSSRDL